MGIGWGLAGLPCIARDDAYPINYNNNDRFLGPSGRLVKHEGYYHNEEETFSRFEEVGTGEQGPTTWIEHLPNGTKRIYGGSEKSKIHAIDHPELIRVWALSSVQDASGNSYKVEYEQDRGQYYPTKIVYTMGPGVSRYRSIEFEYEQRSDSETHYAQNTKVITSRRLK